MRDLHRGLLNRLSAFKVPHRFAVVDRPSNPERGNWCVAPCASRINKPIWELSLAEPGSGVPGRSDDVCRRPTLTIAGEEATAGRLFASGWSLCGRTRQRLVVDAVCAEAAGVR